MERKSRERNKDAWGSRSRDSSGSVSSEVRCGCQYFQSDSLLPERQSMIGRPASRSDVYRSNPTHPSASRPVSRASELTVEPRSGQDATLPGESATQHHLKRARVQKSKSSDSEHEDLTPFLDACRASLDLTMGDHEYEPVIPMASHQQTPPPTVHVTDADNPDVPGGSKADSLIGSDMSSIESHERQLLRIPTDEELISGTNDEELNEEEDVDNLSAKELQTRLEERFFTPTPTTTTGSRTDGEIHTSQVDSSALEDLPLKRDARRSAAQASAGDPKNFQQKLRSHAVRIRTKLRGMSRKPKPNSEEHDGGESSEPSETVHQDKSRFSFPKRPKINFPDRAKFNFPERPKFNFPERPKFNLPSRPKISMPTMPSLTRQKTSSNRRPLKEKNQPPASKSPSNKKMFDFDFRTYPRIFSKKKKLEMNGTKKGTRAQTPPPRMESESVPNTPLRRKGSFGTKWVHKFTDIKFADDDDERSSDKTSRFISLKADPEERASGESLSAFRDSEFTDALFLDDSSYQNKEESKSASSFRSDREQHSSESSTDRLRRGVIEEIDADEFFVRQKGLSRENVEVSNFLTQEIRDAFRSTRNALARLDTELYDDEQPSRDEDSGKPGSTEPTPTPPQRTSRSFRRGQTPSSRKSMDPSLEGEDKMNYFNTFPPDRPQRRRSGTVNSQKDKSSLDSVEMKSLESGVKNSDLDEEYLEKESLKSHPEYYSTYSQQEQHPPLPPKRKRSSKDVTQDNDSLADEMFNHEEWIKSIEAQAVLPGEETALSQTNLADEDADQYDLPPHAPSRKARSPATSLLDEDRTSREAESLPSERLEEFTRAIESCDIMDGYAVVEKSTKNEKPVKPPRPPPPGRQRKRLKAIKSQGLSYFFTVPRRRQSILAQYTTNTPPIRPFRNYSTLGPSRPPRRNKVFREPVYADGDDTENKTRIKTAEDEELERDIEELIKNAINSQLNESILQDDAKDLQSGDVIEKMKTRPLPPPPRPPRKTREDGEYDDYGTTENTDQSIEGHLELHLHNLSQNSEPVVEKVCTQTRRNVDQDTVIHISTIQNDLNKTKSLESFPEVPKRDTSRSGSISRRASTRKGSLTRRSKTPLPEDRVSEDDQMKVVVEDISVATQTDVLPEGYIIEEERQMDDRSQTENSYPTTATTLTGSESTPTTIIERKVLLIPEKEPEIEILKTKKLQVSEIDVEKLNVTEINTTKIRVSDIDSMSLQVAEINSKGGNIVVNNLELPQSFLETLSKNRLDQQSADLSQDSSEPVARPRRQTHRTKHDDSDEESKSVVPMSSQQERRVDHPSEEEGAVCLPTTSQQDPTVCELSLKLFEVIHRNVSRFVDRNIQNGVIDLEKQREIQQTLSIVLIVVAVLYLIGFGSGSTIHTHHWDFQFPPPH